MSLATLTGALPEGHRILLDSSTLVAYLDGTEAAAAPATHIVDEFVRTGRNPAIVSMVTVMEVLVRPVRSGVPGAYRHLLDFLLRFPNLRTVDIDVVVAQEAAAIRAGQGLKSPDALIVATGIVSQVGHLVTNDRTWLTRLAPLSSRIDVCFLGSHLPFP